MSVDRLPAIPDRKTTDLLPYKAPDPRGVGRGSRVVRTTRRKTVRGVRHTAVGTGRAIGRLWKWVVADELLGSDLSPEVILAERARRRTTAKWTALVVTLATGAAWMVWPYAPYVILAGVLLAVAIAEALRPAMDAPASVDYMVEVIATHPAENRVLKGFVDAKIAKSAEQMALLPPGVIRDRDLAWMADIALPAGTAFKDITKKRENVAAAYGLPLSRFYWDPHPDYEGVVRVWSPDTDPLSGPVIYSPNMGRTTPVNIWDEPCPLMFDVRGNPLGVNLTSGGLLIAGAPDTGKSVAANGTLTHFALDPITELWLVDGKGLDLLDYVDIAHRTILRRDQQALTLLLDELTERLEERITALGELRVKKLTKELAEMLGWSVLMFHIDELATFSMGAIGKEILDKLRDVGSRGRAVGIFVSVATQRPSAEVISGDLRDVLSWRLALRCNSATASNMTLGEGWAGRGYNAALIDKDQRGAGLLYAEGSYPQTGRVGYLPDKEVTRLARLAYIFREQAGTLPGYSQDAHVVPDILIDMRDAMDGYGDMWTSDLLERLADAHPTMTAARLAKELKPYGIEPEQIRIDGVNRNGYRYTTIMTAIEHPRRPA